MEYKFTQDWFSWNINIWKSIVIPNLQHRQKFLEIGSFEGRSTVHTVENILEDEGLIYCIDNWNEQEMHITAESNFDFNVKILEKKYPLKKVVKYKKDSFHGIADIIGYGIKDFDLIFIDGFHYAPTVLTDACMSWPLLKVGGILIFDDYSWSDINICPKGPKDGVDAFVHAFNLECKLLFSGHQVILQKIK